MERASKAATVNELESEDTLLPFFFLLEEGKHSPLPSLQKRNTFAEDYLNTKAYRVDYDVLSYHF